MIARGLCSVIRLANDWLFHRKSWQRMGTSMFAIITLVLVALVGCNTIAPVSMTAPPTSIQTPPLSVLIEPTLLAPATRTPTIENGFSIYLVDQNVSPQQLAGLSHLELEKDPLLSINDIFA
jgi:hypothetical protein